MLACARDARFDPLRTEDDVDGSRHNPGKLASSLVCDNVVIVAVVVVSGSNARGWCCSCVLRQAQSQRVFQQPGYVGGLSATRADGGSGCGGRGGVLDGGGMARAVAVVGGVGGTQRFSKSIQVQQVQLPVIMQEFHGIEHLKDYFERLRNNV